jgi:hypothetical protein
MSYSERAAAETYYEIMAQPLGEIRNILEKAFRYLEDEVEARARKEQRHACAEALENIPANYNHAVYDGWIPIDDAYTACMNAEVKG